MRGSYELRVDPSAHKSIQRFPERLACAVAAFITGPLLDNPHRVGAPLRRELLGYHAARVGVLRVVYRILEDEQQVRVVRIAHRADVYRPR